MIEHYENSSSLESRICLEETQNQLIENIQESLQDLDKQTKQFSFFDLGLSDYDIKTLSKIKTVQKTIKGIYSIDDLGTLSVESEELNQTETGHLNCMILNLVKTVIKESGKNDAKIYLIFSTKDAFLIPIEQIDQEKPEYQKNYHIDKTLPESLNMCPSKEMSEDKYAFVIPLIGETTLYQSLTETQKEIFTKKAYQDRRTMSYTNNTKGVDPVLYEELFSDKTVQRASPGHGSVHFTGVRGTLHSQPKIENQRLVIAIFPGDTWALKKFYNSAKSGLV